jgi:hypothetical protein
MRLSCVFFSLTDVFVSHQETEASEDEPPAKRRRSSRVAKKEVLKRSFSSLFPALAPARARAKGMHIPGSLDPDGGF